MKTILGIGILLICAATHVLSVPFQSSSVIKRHTVEEEGEIEYIVTFANQKRREWAQQHQISNMHEMRYDTGLEDIAKTLTCRTMTRPGPNYMPAQFPDNRGLKLFQTGDEQQQIEAAKGLMGAFVAPEQTKFGCAEMKPPCQGPGGQIQAVCVTGPKTSFNSWDAKRGPPGSQCNHGTDSTGMLCKDAGQSSNFGQRSSFRQPSNVAQSSNTMHHQAGQSSVEAMTVSFASSFRIYTVMILITLSAVN